MHKLPDAFSVLKDVIATCSTPQSKQAQEGEEKTPIELLQERNERESKEKAESHQKKYESSVTQILKK